MPCLLGCLALTVPRFTIILVAIFSNAFGRAFDTALWPILGFLFLPTSTLAYTWAINSTGELAGLPLAIFIIALLVDLGVVGGNARSSFWRRDED